MCFIYHILCGCCYSKGKEKDKSRMKSLSAHSSRTMTTRERSVNQAVNQASAPSRVKTTDLTQLYEIPNNDFQTDSEVITENGFKIYWDEILGKGNYGIVYRAMFLKDETIVAVKVLPLDDRKESNLNNMIKNELFVMEKTSHPHIIQVFKHFIIKDKTNHMNQVFIFMRFAENSSLSEYVRRDKTPMDETKAKRLFAQIVSAVDSMHSLGIAHRDLKLGNILLDSNMNVMVSDFGLSRVAFRRSQNRLIECYERVGTPQYMAPEILVFQSRKKPYDPFAADIWALGVILWAIINRSYPFGDEPQQIIRRQIRFEQLNPKVSRYFEASRDLQDIIRRIFRYDRENRIKMPELVEHNWIKDEINLINDKIKSQNL